MAEITVASVGQRFKCGSDYENLMLIEFKGPNGAKIVAYCCNMNIDFDGEPHAYAPLDHAANIQPMDVLGNAGYKTPVENEKERLKFENVKSQIAALETQKANAKTVQEKLGLQTRIDELNRADILTKYKGAKNYGKKFWHWYGVISMSPARKKEVYYDKLDGAVAAVLVAFGLTKSNTLPRNPDLYDKNDAYEDVNGEFPVVQSILEPGPGYFVSSMPRARNNDFPNWDQRYYLAPGTMKQGAYGALTVPHHRYPSLAGSTGLKLGDAIFAVRLDKAIDLTFPFRDTGYGPKVGECSIDAFLGLGGVIKHGKAGKAYYINEFPVLYLTFPNRQTPQSALENFATASNPLDFALVLSFLAKVTVETPRLKKPGTNSYPHTVNRDPLAEFNRWKKALPLCNDIVLFVNQILPFFLPAHFAHIANALHRAGFNLPNLAHLIAP